MGQCYCAVVTTVSFAGVRPVHVMNVERHQGLPTLRSTQLNSTQPEITDACVWHLYVRIINNITIL